MAITDLLTKVRGILPPRYGGTGSIYGEQRVVIPCINNTGSTIALYSIVQLRHGSQDLRIKPVVDANSRKVFGVVIGYMDPNGYTVEDDVTDGGLAAVQTAGVARALIDTDVARGDYACSSTTDGTITSDAALVAGAFAIVVDTAVIANGDTYARIAFPLVAGSGATDHDDLTGVTADQHHDEDHAARHDDGGPDGMAIDAAAGTGSLRTLGTGATQAAAGTHTHTGSGGAGSGWTRIIDEDGTSFAAWTVITGTWSSDGTNIKQASTAASFARAYYTTKLRLVPATIRWEFRFDSGGSGDDYAGMSIGTTGTGGGAAVRPEIVSGVSQIRIEAEDGSGATDTYTSTDGVPTWVRGTWYAMEVRFDGFTTTIWVDGTLIGTNRVLLPASRLYNYFRLLTHSAAVDFRNITVDTLDGS